MPYKNPKDPRFIAIKKRYYQNNKKKIFETRKTLRRGTREKLFELKEGGKCVDCGNSYHPCAMDFDHRDPLTKTISIGEATYRWGWERLLKEIQKCDLVCAVCHRIRHRVRYENGDYHKGSLKIKK